MRVLGVIKNKRAYRWIRSEYITGPESFDKYKVALPAGERSPAHWANGCSSPLSSSPQVAVTQTFITIGSFGTEAEAEACLKYVKSKFARAMLGVLKVTQHNPAQHLEVRPAAGLHVGFRHRLDQADPGDRPAAVRQVRPRRRGDRLHRGQDQADGMTGEAALEPHTGELFDKTNAYVAENY